MIRDLNEDAMDVTLCDFFAALECSHDVLSVIFGIFGKFWIDIAIFYLEKILFFRKSRYFEENSWIFCDFLIVY